MTSVDSAHVDEGAVYEPAAQKTGLARFLDSLYLKKGHSYAGLSVFPIVLVSREFQRSDETFHAVGTAGDGAHVIIEETCKLDSVGLKNKGREKAVALDGTAISGATQCRLLESSAVLEPGEKIELPACGTKCDHSEILAESGAFPRYAFPAASHRRMVRIESIERKNGDELFWNQSRVWGKLRDLFHDLGFSRPSMDVENLYRHWSLPIEDYTLRYRLEPMQMGMITFVDNDMWFMDLFLNPSLMRSMFAPLLKSYAIEAVIRRMKSNKETTNSRGPKIEVAQEVIGYMKTMNYRPMAFKGAALKDSFYIDAKKACGTALINNGRLVYLAAYSKDKAPREY